MKTLEQRAASIFNEEYPAWINREAQRGKAGLEFRLSRENAFYVGVIAGLKAAPPSPPQRSGGDSQRPPAPRRPR